MKKILLTSAGFENERLARTFLDLAGKPAGEIRALFIPTAANNPDAIAVLPKCMDDLLHAGIPKENIAVFDLHRALTDDEMSRFDAVYFTGGSSRYLLERILDTRFDGQLTRFIERGGIYIGVSAGSIVATDTLPGGLGYIRCTLNVHTQEGTQPGAVDTAETPHINLTDSAALLLHGEDCQVIQ